MYDIVSKWLFEPPRFFNEYVSDVHPMATVKIGQTAPDVTLRTVDNEAVQLAQAWSGGRNALLIFLRHLA